MPAIVRPPTTTNIRFLVSVPLDLVNAIYFTYLVEEAEGIEDWPARTLPALAPDLRSELDFLFTYPASQPGIMGALNDLLFLRPESWADLDALLNLVRDLPDGPGESPAHPGIQGLVLYATRWELGRSAQAAASAPPREAIAQAATAAGRDPERALAVFDRPADLRRRMLALLERFYQEHYRHDLPRRLPCMERSVAAHATGGPVDPDELIRSVTGRPVSCLKEEPGAYTDFIFSPSLDMGPYNSCADLPPVHGLYYPCEARFQGERPDADEERVRLARVYRALSDEQRLRILDLLRSGGEMYAQEIMQQTGLHQSVVSRHLSFMKAVGLLLSRRQNNMKFFSINPEMRDELDRSLDLFLGSGGSQNR